MTREEAQRLREEEMAAQAQGKDCFIIPQANLDRFLPDGVTVSFIHQCLDFFDSSSRRGEFQDFQLPDKL